MIKVVHYLPNLTNGGIETMLLNYYKKINNFYEFIIVIHGTPTDNCLKKFLDLKCKVYQIPSWKEHFWKNMQQLYKILKIEKPTIFHTHHNLNNFIPCFYAMLAGIKIRIHHNHLYLPKKNLKQKIYKILSNLFSTNQAACGCCAAQFIAKKNDVNNVKIIYNAIYLNQFEYKENVRQKIRNKYDWQNCKVYGNVGRFSKQKNQLFLIDVFEEIYKNDLNARFVIIGGDGDQYENVINKLKLSSIFERTLVLKNIKNVNEFYLGMDCMILPSLYEGFAVTIVEAQISNLPCIVSGTITKEFTSNSLFFINGFNKYDWAQKVKDISFKRSNKINHELVRLFDINVVYKNLKEYYDCLIEEEMIK